MREIKFRAWDIDPQRYRYLNGSHDMFGFDAVGNAYYYNLQDGSEGEEYILEQFTGLRDLNAKDIYEGDIVDVWGSRSPKYGNSWRLRSQFDLLHVHARAVVVFERGQWQIGSKNAFNDAIIALQGNETEERSLHLPHDLYHYFFFQPENPDSEWNLKHNRYANDREIFVIGNIHENPELLNV